MSTKKAELAEAGKQQASIVVNNSFIDGLVAQLQDKENFGLTFPSDYNYQNELLGAYLVLKETVDANKQPVLESCTQVSIANSLMRMVRSGLSMQNGQCYPIAYGGKLNIQPSVYGNIHNARRHGLKDINSSVIYKGDTFKFHKEYGMTVIDEHITSFENMDNDNIIGAYAVAIMQDGTKKAEVMNMSQIKKSWEQGYGYKENGNGTHQKFTDQMAEKTVKNRLLKHIIRTHGEPNEVKAFEEMEETENINVVEENMKYDIETNANQIQFEETVDNIIDGDVRDITDAESGESQQELPFAEM